MAATGSSFQVENDPVSPEWLAVLSKTAPLPWLVWWPHQPGFLQKSADCPFSPDDQQSVADQIIATFRGNTGLAILMAGLEAEGTEFYHQIDHQWAITGLSPSGRHPRLRHLPCLLWFQKIAATGAGAVSEKTDAKNDHPILDHLSTGVALFDPALMMTGANRAWWRLLGMPRPDRLPVPLAVVLAESRDRHALPASADFGRFCQDLADWLRRADETPLDLHFANGQMQRWTAFARHGDGPMVRVDDITEQMELTRSLAAMGAVQRQSLDHLREGIMVIGADGRLRYHNAALLVLMGLEKSGGAGDLLTPWLDQAWRPLLVAAENSDGFDWLLAPPPQQTVWRLKNGRVLEGQSARLPDGACLVCLTDVTAREQAADALRLEADHQAEINRLKSGLWTSLAYRLRTPLTSIVGYGEALAAGFFGALAPAKAAAFENLLTASRDLQSMIERMIDVAALQAGLEQLDRQPIDLFALLRQIGDDVQIWSQRQQRFLRLDLPATSAMVLGDVRRLNALFFDIFTDLLQEMPENSTLVAVGYVSQQSIEMTLCNTIYRSHSAPHNGLGHSMAQSLLGLHDGDLVQRQLGEWVITLPLYQG